VAAAEAAAERCRKDRREKRGMRNPSEEKPGCLES